VLPCWRKQKSTQKFASETSWKMVTPNNKREMGGYKKETLCVSVDWNGSYEGLLFWWCSIGIF
jgi:hypothetical protein